MDEKKKGQEMAMKSRRKKRIINFPFQFKFAVAIMLNVFAVTALLSCIQFSVLSKLARTRMMAPSQPEESSILMIVVLFALGFATLTSCAIGFWSFFMTHRICGPLYVMRGYFDELAQGRFPKMRPLRRKDLLKDFYEAFESAVTAMKLRRQGELQDLNRALDLAAALATSNTPEIGAELADAIRQLEPLRRELAEEPESAGSDSADSEFSPSAEPTSAIPGEGISL